MAGDNIPCDDSTRVCLLSEVFARFPGTPIHLDIKDADHDFVCAVFALVEQYGREGATFIGTSNPDNSANIARYFGSMAPERRRRFRRFAGVRDFALAHLFFYLGVLPYVTLDYDVFSIPVWTHTMRGVAGKEIGGWKVAVGAFLFTSPVMWRHMQRRGIAVVDWVLNTELDFAEAQRWPLDGVMSDDLVLLHCFLTRMAMEKTEPMSVQEPEGA